MLRSLFANLMISSRSYARNIRKSNPGIGNRQELLRIGDEFEQFDLDDIDDFETDFANAGKVLDEKEREDLKLANLTRLRIARRKHFAQKLPNLLYWSEKEQIRYLYENETGEWTCESLADSFPATPETISKVIKSKWRPGTNDRIEAHDRNVQKNWLDFKAGKLNGLSEKFCEHLAKFGDRRRPPTPKTTTTEKNPTITARVGRTEFRDIIRNYNRDLKLLQLKNGDETKSERSNESQAVHEDVQIARNESLFEQTGKLDSDENTFVLRKKTSISKRMVTLDRLQDNLSRKSKRLNETDKEFLQQLNDLKKKNSTKETDEEKSETVAEQVDVAVGNENNKIVLEMEPQIEPETRIERTKQTIVTYESPRVIQSPNWIRIPSQKYKRNATYKLNDSFYDSDGQFLYRVPGLK